MLVSGRCSKSPLLAGNASKGWKHVCANGRGRLCKRKVVNLEEKSCLCGNYGAGGDVSLRPQKRKAQPDPSFSRSAPGLGSSPFILHA
jgi:hypothetical protein